MDPEETTEEAPEQVPPPVPEEPEEPADPAEEYENRIHEAITSVMDPQPEED